MAKVLQTKLKQAKTSVDKLGNSQLRVGKRFSLSGWLLFDGIVLMIIIGVAAVRLTHAGVNYTFMVNPSQMQGGSLSRNIATGESRRLVSNGIHAETTAIVTADQIAASTEVCADIHVSSKNTFVDIQLNGQYASQFADQAGDKTVCVVIDKAAGAGTIYAGTSGNAEVHRIYGVQ